MGLKMWKNETDWVIAETEQEAIKVWEKYTGESWENYCADDQYNEFNQVNPTEKLTFCCDLLDYEPDNYPKEARHSGVIGIEAKVHEWTKEAARPQFWGSTEH